MKKQKIKIGTSAEDEWSSSDDEALHTKVKQMDSRDDLIRPRKCCPRVCYRLISVPTQQFVYEKFAYYEKKNLGNSYLANCMELPKPDVNMSAEIASESNGNMEISNEIEKAINESLMDQASENDKNGRTDPWIYSIVVDDKPRTVCCEFFVKLFRIDVERIHLLQRSIMNAEKDGWKNQLPEYHALHTFLLGQSDRLQLYELFKKYKQFYFENYHQESAISFNKFKWYMKDFNLNSHIGCDIIKNKDKDLSARKKRKQISDKTVLETRTSTEKSPKSRGRKPHKRDVLSLMGEHLKTQNYKISKKCLNHIKHKYLPSNVYSINALYEDYRKYFLTVTNSELGLRFPVYEKLFLSNKIFGYEDLSKIDECCPKCLLISKPLRKGKTVGVKDKGLKKKTKTFDGENFKEFV